MPFAKLSSHCAMVERIACPLLIMHGENDRQVPLDNAPRSHDEAVNSPKRTLRIFTAEEGGDAHVQSDNRLLAIDFMSDWIEQALGGHAA